MWQIVLKDLEQHSRALILFFLSSLALPIGFFLLKPTGADNSGIVGVNVGYLVLSAPMLFAFWLVGQEKLKGTLRLLKILPLSGMRIVTAKALTGLALCALLNLLFLRLSPLILGLLGFHIAFPGREIFFWMCLAAAFFVAVNIAIFTAFDYKIAMQISYFGIFGVLAALMTVEKFLPRRGVNVMELLTGAWRQWRVAYWGWLPILTLSVLCVLVAGRLFECREWPELEDG
jgi:ABC-type transport system involved in multi-copper enzyme maturation permease subunit